MLPQAYAIPAAGAAVEAIGPVLAPLAIAAAAAVFAAFAFLAWGAIVHAPTAGLFVGPDTPDVGTGERAPADAPAGDARGRAVERLVA